MLARFVSLILLSVVSGLTAVSADNQAPKVRLQTSLGEIVVQLDAQTAPLSVANFLAYVDKAHYDGTIFHRVMPGFMIQGGGFTAGFDRRVGGEPIRNEADNGLKNLRGTIAMARTQDPHSATSQFFINTVDNGFLDHREPTARGWGYAVFGKVVEGMETVDRISAVPTGRHDRYENVPKQAIVIQHVARIDGD
ncbi:MAG: peptidylprolyl isomerase [Gammaproteobacteria bacterium]|nr:peptidylprolyl isomerase [Gammaproteobacteria bacterium]